MKSWIFDKRLYSKKKVTQITNIKDEGESITIECTDIKQYVYGLLTTLLL